jgi:DNA-directed RNA polymerase subunit RPC12/RpoP
MPLYRCLECNRQFEAAKPVCAECGIDPEKDKRDEGVVVELMTIHFDPPTKRAGRGHNYAACDPKLKVGHPRCQFTSEPDAVNCAKCKETEAFKASGGFSNGAVPMKVGPLKK